MSQALHTSMSGLNAATQAISVVSNNVANINTTAYKAASARFENLFSRTYTTGNSPTKTTGGVNPMQIGMGVQVGSIVRNFTPGTFESTGVPTDLMLSGGGYFTVTDEQGQVYLTRDGAFTFDAEGNFVTQSGLYVMGAEQIYNTSGSKTHIKIPQTLKTDAKGSNLQSVALKDLNDCDITEGTFVISYKDNVDTTNITVNITPDMLNMRTDAFLNEVQRQISDVLDFSGKAKDAISVGFSGEKGTIVFQTTKSYSVEVAVEADTLISGNTYYKYQNMKIPADGAEVTPYFNDEIVTADKLKTVPVSASPNLYDQTGNVIKVNGQPVYVTASTANANKSLPNSIAEVAYYDNAQGKYVTMTVNPANAVETTNEQVYPTLSFTAGTSNFLEATRLASAIQDTSNGKYQSKILDYTVDVSPAAALSEAVSVESYAIGNNGTIEVTYSNGDKITVEPNVNDNTFGFKYTTATGVVIRGGDHINISGEICQPENFVLQLATVRNEAGLVSQNNNLWSIGPNSGDIVYAVGGAMGCGEVQSGGLEASNVDLSQELANMILAQRAIQANSRVFGTASEVMEVLSYLGQ